MTLTFVFINCGELANNLGYLLYDMQCIPQNFGNNGTVVATIRDFSDTHPDFEAFGGTIESLNLVSSTLGIDDKPIFNRTTGTNSPTLQMLTTADNFNDWYNTIGGATNEEFTVNLNFVNSGGNMYEYVNTRFFPLSTTDGFGDQGYTDPEGTPRNFHFTTEIHVEFTYMGGEEFTFIGDDDLWLFIDGNLEIDLGGTHPPRDDTLYFDSLGLTLGENYDMHIFHAERRCCGSNFTIITNVSKCINQLVKN